jgi:hypothetical protein
MENEFSKKISKLMNEQGYQSYGTQNTPVEQKVWPDTSSGQPNLSSVTDGSTTPMGAPRSDMNAQENGGEVDNEVMGEIASLLITMGFILQQAGVITDKYDTKGIIDFLTGMADVLGSGNPTDDQGGEVEIDVVGNDDGGSEQPEGQPEQQDASTPAVSQPAQDPNMVDEKKKNLNPMMESRKLLESKIKSSKKKKIKG